jgi:outer membrane lipoprotein-sorting protein
MKKILLIFIFLINAAFTQSKNPDEILNKVKENFDKVKNYIVDIDVKVDVNFLKVPDSKAKIYFKQPDKIKFESDNFALLPKEGLNFSPLAILKNKYTAIYEKDENLNGINTSVIKVIPLNDKSDIILTTLWIDTIKNVIIKSESTTKINGTFSMEFNYNNSIDNYPLPSSMVFTLNVDDKNIPKRINEDIESEQKPKKENKKKSTTGKVYINYYNYKVNMGVPDEVFNKKNKEK